MRSHGKTNLSGDKRMFMLAAKVGEKLDASRSQTLCIDFWILRFSPPRLLKQWPLAFKF